MGKSSNETTCASNDGRLHDLNTKRDKFHVGVEVGNQVDQYDTSNRRKRLAGKANRPLRVKWPTVAQPLPKLKGSQSNLSSDRLEYN